MKYAIRVEEVKGKTLIVEANSLDEAIDKVECSDSDFNLDDECPDYFNVVVSPDAMEDGTATPKQLEWCEEFREVEYNRRV